MGIDITNVSYLAFRMAPFIIVCYFILQSLLNWDLKGIIYLAGLLFCSVAIVLFHLSRYNKNQMLYFFSKKSVEEGSFRKNQLRKVLFEKKKEGCFHFFFIFVLNYAHSNNISTKYIWISGQFLPINFILILFQKMDCHWIARNISPSYFIQVVF